MIEDFEKSPGNVGVDVTHGIVLAKDHSSTGFKEGQVNGATNLILRDYKTEQDQTSSRPGYTSMPSLMNSLPMRAA